MLSDAATRNAAAASFQAAMRRGTQLDESGQLGNRKHALFGLLMQATAGDCRMSKPPEPSTGGDEVLRWMAWKKRQGMTREAAMQAYVDQINLIDEELSTGGAAIMESAYGSNGYYSSGELLASSEPIYKTGILYKQRDVFKGWRPRKFILKDGVLSYYISDDDPAPRNQLILEGCTVEALKVPSSSKRIDGEVVGFYPFVVTHPDSIKAYYLASTCAEDTDDWIKAIRSVATPARRVSIRRKASMDNSRHYRRMDSANGVDGVGNGQRNIGELGGDDLRALMSGIGSSLIPFEMWGSVSKAMDLLQEYTSSTDGWDPAYCRSDVQVYRRTGGVVSCVRGDGLIEQHPVSVLLAILDLDRRRLYDGQLEFARRVKLFNAHTFLDYLRCRAVWPTSARDLYMTVHWQVLDDGTVVLVKFTDNDKYPEEAGCVRAECILAGWVIRPVANPSLLPPTPSHHGAAAPTAPPTPAGEGSRGQLWSNVTFVEQLDLKGTLPTRIKNSVAEGQPMLIASLRKFLQTHEGSDDYRCPREQQVGYNNPTVEVLLDNLNRRVLASEAAQPVTKRPVHQRSLSIKEIQSDLPYHLDGQIEDAVQALLEEEEKMEGWDLFHDNDGDTGYMKEGDDADLSVLRVRTQGVIEHPALAVLQAITTLDFVNIWDSAIEFSTHEMLHNVHTWITYERLKAMYPMPSRDVCQLVHWRIIEDQGKLVVVSVDNDSHPEDAAYVRAHMYEGWVLHPSKDKKSCRVTTIWSVDIRGVMTNKIRRQMAQNQAAKLSSVRRFLDEYRRGSGAASVLALQPVELTNLAVQPLVVQWNHWSPAMLPDRINLGDAVPRKRRGSSLANSPSGTLTPASRHDSKALDMDLRLAALSMTKLPRSVSAPASHTTSFRRASEPSRPLVMSGILSSMPGTPVNQATHSRPPRPRSTSKTNEDLPQAPLPALSAHPQSSPPSLPSQPSSAWSTPHRKIPTPFTHLESPTTTPFLTSPAATPFPSSFKEAASSPISEASALVVPPPPSLVATSIYHLFLLLSPVLLYFSADPAYRGITFCLAVIASVRMVVLSRSSRSYASAFRGTEWGQDSIKSKVFVRCPVQLTYLKRYLVAKRKAGMKASVVHVAIKALGRALTEVPQLNGHVLLGRFVPGASVDVSYEAKLKNREETSALIKLCGVEGRSVPDLAVDLEGKTSALLQCRDPFFERRKLLLSLCPTPLVPLLDQLFTYLGAGLGLSLPRLGIRAFPQGSAVVIVSPSVDGSSTSPSTSGHTPSQPPALDCEYMVEPDERTGQYLAPLVLNIGSVSPMARMVDKDQGLAMVEVLHISITARLNGTGNLQDVRRLADKVQTYMRNPELLDRPPPSPARSLAPAASASD